MILEREAGPQHRGPGRAHRGCYCGVTWEMLEHTPLSLPDRGNGLGSELLGPLRDLYLKPTHRENPSASPFTET